MHTLGVRRLPPAQTLPPARAGRGATAGFCLSAMGTPRRRQCRRAATSACASPWESHQGNGASWAACAVVAAAIFTPQRRSGEGKTARWARRAAARMN